MFKKKFKVCLIGFGRFGKKYFENLKKSSLFSVDFIIRKNKYNKVSSVKTFNNLAAIKNKNIDGVIIVSPPDTHFDNCKFFLKKEIPIILEKPAVSNIKQLNNLIKIRKKNTIIHVNHPDLYNPLFEKIGLYKKQIGKIKFVTFNFGKFDYQYTVKRKVLPCIDWLPHILATLTFFLNQKIKLEVKKNYLIVKRKCYFQEVKIDVWDKKNRVGEIKYSNFEKNRNINIYGSKGHIRYDSYNIKNNFVKIKNKIIRFDKYKFKSPMENLFCKFYLNIKKGGIVNELKTVLKYQKYLDEINRIIMRANAK